MRLPDKQAVPPPGCFAFKRKKTLAHDGHVQGVEDDADGVAGDAPELLSEAVRAVLEASGGFLNALARGLTDPDVLAASAQEHTRRSRARDTRFAGDILKCWATRHAQMVVGWKSDGEKEFSFDPEKGMRK